jgi:hypothetical protein
VIQEVRRQGFDKSWFSHKFNGPAVKYEVATCIKTGDIVWIHGPFPGAKHDLTIFRSKLAWMLHPLEWTWADLGYIGHHKIITPDNLPWCMKGEFERARAYHEVINGRFKRFGILRDVYRHSVHKHYFR